MKTFPLIKKLRHFLQSEDGPTAVEYAIMLALIVVVCLGAVGSLGVEVADFYQDSADKIESATD
ncbi:MAG: Flp family type IVb pilin [bacterium]|nr:Flp family type IVb pilin [bacterium]